MAERKDWAVGPSWVAGASTAYFNARFGSCGGAIFATMSRKIGGPAWIRHLTGDQGLRGWVRQSECSSAVAEAGREWRGHGWAVNRRCCCRASVIPVFLDGGLPGGFCVGRFDGAEPALAAKDYLVVPPQRLWLSRRAVPWTCQEPAPSFPLGICRWTWARLRSGKPRPDDRGVPAVGGDRRGTERTTAGKGKRANSSRRSLLNQMGDLSRPLRLWHVEFSRWCARLRSLRPVPR